jgi:hypothetical protein
VGPPADGRRESERLTGSRHPGQPFSILREAFASRTYRLAREAPMPQLDPVAADPAAVKSFGSFDGHWPME